MSTEVEPAATPGPVPGVPGSSAAVRQAFGVGSILSRAFSVWRRNLGAFSAIAVAFALPSAALTLASGGAGAAATGAPAGRAAWILGQVLALATTGALTYGVLQALAGREVRLGAMAGVGLKKLGKLFLVSLGVGLIVVLGLFLLVVPGAIAAAMYWVAAPAAVAEQGGAGEAMSRSAALTKGHRLTIFAAVVVTTLATLAVALAVDVGLRAVVSLVAGPDAVDLPVFDAAVELVAAALGSFLSAAPAVAYHDLRVMKEGVDTGQLARVFD